MINYNLSGNALIHCLKVAGSNLILVDHDPNLSIRIKDVQSEIENDLKMNIRIMDGATKAQIYDLKAEKPKDVFRDRVQGNWPMSIFYTR
jgi:hypothetical protein